MRGRVTLRTLIWLLYNVLFRVETGGKSALCVETGGKSALCVETGCQSVLCRGMITHSPGNTASKRLAMSYSDYNREYHFPAVGISVHKVKTNVWQEGRVTFSPQEYIDFSFMSRGIYNVLMQSRIVTARKAYTYAIAEAEKFPFNIFPYKARLEQMWYQIAPGYGTKNPTALRDTGAKEAIIGALFPYNAGFAEYMPPVYPTEAMFPIATPHTNFLDLGWFQIVLEPLHNLVIWKIQKETLGSVRYDSYYSNFFSRLDAIHFNTHEAGGIAIGGDSLEESSIVLTWGNGGNRPYLSPPFPRFADRMSPHFTKSKQKGIDDMPAYRNLTNPTLDSSTTLASNITLATPEAPFEPDILASAFLWCKTTSSDKGYVSIVKTTQSGQFHHETYSGKNGNVKIPQNDDYYPSRAAAESAHDTIVSEKIRKRGYKYATAADIGFVEVRTTGKTVGGTVSPPSRIISLMEFTALEATAAKEKIEDPRYATQFKIDGERCVVRLEGGKVLFINKNGQLRGGNDPVTEAVLALAPYLGPEFTLDAEEVTVGKIYVFDLINAANFEDRIQTLKNVRQFFTPALVMVQTAFTRAEKDDMMATAIKHNMEGVVIKDKYSVYVHGRSTNDFKYKFWHDCTVRFIRVNPGEKTAYGSVGMEMYGRGDIFIEVGNVSSGFKAGEIEAIANRLAAGEQIFADVKYMYFTGKALYQPGFKKFRPDKDENGIATTQLFGKEGATIFV